MMSKFKQLSEKIQKKQGVSEKSANAIAATIGRNKYGANVFTKLAAKANKGKKKQYEAGNQKSSKVRI